MTNETDLHEENCEEVDRELKTYFAGIFLFVTVMGMVGEFTIKFHGQHLFICFDNNHFVGNGVSVAVLVKNNGRKNKILSNVYRLYVIALAFADSGVLIFNGILRYVIISLLYDPHKPSWVYEVYLCRWHRLFMHGSHNFAVWLLVVMTFDRFLAACLPFTYKRTNHSTKKAKTIIIAVCVLSFLFAAPYLLAGGVFESKHDGGLHVAEIFMNTSKNESKNVIFNNDDRLHGTLNTTDSQMKLVFGCSLMAQVSPDTAYLINLILHVCVAFLIPYVIIILLNAAIFRKLNCQPNSSVMVRSRRRMNRKITVMMLSVSLTFILLWIPQAVVMLTHADAHSHSCDGDQILEYLAALSGITNSALNFFLYCVTVKRFRSEVRKLVFSTRTCKTTTTNEQIDLNSIKQDGL
ncbi:putative G-protein coupled receptor 139 isoform X1 [Ciona intestinalis]